MASIWIALFSSLAFAGKGTVEVPIDVGVGPATHLMSGPIAQQQTLHTGLAFSIEAILDKKTIRKFKNRIPPQYRKMALSLDEVRISHPLIPHTFFISPAGIQQDTGIYGLSLRPIGLDVPLIRGGFRFEVGIGARLTYFYMHSKTLPAPMHFLRPGLDAVGEAEIAFSDTFLVSFGWGSQFYIPQEVGGPVFATAPLDESVWHIGEAFLKLHFRVPVDVKR